MNKASLYNKLVYETLAYYITEQLPFQLQIPSTKELQGYLPAEAFRDGILLIDFREWILEEALVFDTTLECIIVFGETEYPISIQLVDIDSIIDLDDFHLVMKKTFDTEGAKIEVFESYEVKDKITAMEKRTREYEKRNAKQLAHSREALLKHNPKFRKDTDEKSTS